MIKIQIFRASKDTTKKVKNPDQCGSLGWVSFHKAKGHQFDPWSRHMPELWVQSLVGAHMRGNQSMFLSLSFSLPSPLSKNK